MRKAKRRLNIIVEIRCPNCKEMVKDFKCHICVRAA